MHRQRVIIGFSEARELASAYGVGRDMLKQWLRECPGLRVFPPGYKRGKVLRTVLEARLREFRPAGVKKAGGQDSAGQARSGLQF